MKKFVKLLAAVAMSAVCVGCGTKHESTKHESTQHETAKHETMEDLSLAAAQAVTAGDWEAFEKLLSPDAMTDGYIQGQLKEEIKSCRYKKELAGKKFKCIGGVTEFAGRMRISPSVLLEEDEKAGEEYSFIVTDFLTVEKIGDEWKIVRR